MKNQKTEAELASGVEGKPALVLLYTGTTSTKYALKYPLGGRHLHHAHRQTDPRNRKENSRG